MDMTKQERVCERHTRYANADGDDHAGDGEGHGGSYNSLQRANTDTLRIQRLR